MTALALGASPDLGLSALLRRVVELLAPARAPERKWAERLAAVDADGRFCGYASLFGRMDLAGDIVMPGAFRATLRKRGVGGVKMLLEHDPRAPIGVWERIEEDRFGLWVDGRLRPSFDAARAARAMSGGELDGLSIGFRTLGAEEDRSARVRRLTEIDLWEVSVVRTPMLPEARARAHGRDPGGRVPDPRCPTAEHRGRRGAGHADVGTSHGTAADAGLIARMRREAANLLGQMG